MSQTKLVNLRSNVPITGLSIPRVGTIRGIRLSIEDIRICLQSHARVEEIVDGKVIPLGFDNYAADNSTKKTAPTTPKTTPVKTESVKVEAPTPVKTDIDRIDTIAKASESNIKTADTKTDFVKTGTDKASTNNTKTNKK